MKALSIWQPYASLIAINAKHYETRGWATKYRGPLAIHAAAKSPAAVLKILDTDTVGLIEKALDPCGTKVQNIGHLRVKGLPTGKVIAIALLTDCIPITEEFAASVSAEERAFGDWTPGRYAWKFEKVLQLPFFIKAKGQQGLWNFRQDSPPYIQTIKLSDELLNGVKSQAETIPEDLPDPTPHKYRADIALYNLFPDNDELPADRVGADVEYFTEGDDLESVRDEAMHQVLAVCLHLDIPAGKSFEIVLTLSSNGEHVDTDEGSATWDGEAVKIDL